MDGTAPKRRPTPARTTFQEIRRWSHTMAASFRWEQSTQRVVRRTQPVLGDLPTANGDEPRSISSAQGRFGRRPVGGDGRQGAPDARTGERLGLASSPLVAVARRCASVHSAVPRARVPAGTRGSPAGCWWSRFVAAELLLVRLPHRRTRLPLLARSCCRSASVSCWLPRSRCRGSAGRAVGRIGTTTRSSRAHRHQLRDVYSLNASIQFWCSERSRTRRNPLQPRCRGSHSSSAVLARLLLDYPLFALQARLRGIEFSVDLKR